MNLDKHGLTICNDIRSVTYTDNGIVFQTSYNTDKQKVQQLAEYYNKLAEDFDSAITRPPTNEFDVSCELDNYKTNISVLKKIMDEEEPIDYQFRKIYPKLADKYGEILKFAVLNKNRILFDYYSTKVINMYNNNCEMYHLCNGFGDIDENYVKVKLHRLLF